jgi:hypothetical protein
VINGEEISHLSFQSAHCGFRQSQFRINNSEFEIDSLPLSALSSLASVIHKTFISGNEEKHITPGRAAGLSYGDGAGYQTLWRITIQSTGSLE